MRAPKQVVSIAAAALFMMLAGGASSALAQNTVLEVHNRTSSYVTVSVDGLYGCNTAGHTTCTIPVTVGDHHLHAVRLDTGEWLEDYAYIPEEGLVWTLTEE